MDEILINFAFLLSRYLHVVATALLVGGMLFYELIVPVAIDEMKDEQKLWIFARARWAFRGLVWFCAAVIILTGAATTYRNWAAYKNMAEAGPWWMAHAILGVLGIGIALGLVAGPRPPRYPLAWMRVTLMILMVAIFLGTTAEYVRRRPLSVEPQVIALPPIPYTDEPDSEPGNTQTAPSTSPAQQGPAVAQ
ncbi:hypothetical protein [Fontivita pretiosa]|uniref:hypothetical protein n=1 Tax=Fontivita pretiosa TaxID=2989684 RepID=UPI003D16A886